MLLSLAGIDLIEHRDEVLEHGVDLGGHIARLQYLSRFEPLAARAVGKDQVDELGAEDRGGADLRLDIGRDELQLVRVDLEAQRDRRALLAVTEMSATRPTCTPRILTLALVSITRPARSEVSVTGTVDVRVPVNNA